MPEFIKVAVFCIFGIFMLCGVSYFIYHAAIIADKINSASNNIDKLLFPKQLGSTWRTAEIDKIIDNDPELKAYVDKIEGHKALFFASAFGIGIIVSLIFTNT